MSSYKVTTYINIQKKTVSTKYENDVFVEFLQCSVLLSRCFNITFQSSLYEFKYCLPLLTYS